MMGPGKYDEFCTYVQERTGGSVIVIVIGGNRGNGFSGQTTLREIQFIPEILEQIARDLRRDREGGHA